MLNCVYMHDGIIFNEKIKCLDLALCKPSHYYYISNKASIVVDASLILMLKYCISMTTQNVK